LSFFDIEGGVFDIEKNPSMLYQISNPDIRMIKSQSLLLFDIKDSFNIVHGIGKKSLQYHDIWRSYSDVWYDVDGYVVVYGCSSPTNRHLMRYVVGTKPAVPPLAFPVLSITGQPAL
jgi:hypothetical protein